MKNWLDKYQDGDSPIKRDNTQVVNPILQKQIGSPTRNQGNIDIPYQRSLRENLLKALDKLDRHGDNQVANIATQPSKALLSLMRPDKYFDNVNSDRDIIPALQNLGTDIGMVAPVINEISPYGKSLLNKSSISKTVNRVFKQSPDIRDHLIGIGAGMNDNRPFFEKFPITKNQKNNAYRKQDVAFNEAKKFVEDYYYGDSWSLRPEIEERIRNIDPDIRYSGTNMKTIFNTEPITNTKNKLVSSRTSALTNSDLSDEQKAYIYNNRGKIAGVNFGYDPYTPDEALTLRNYGMYNIPPDKIKHTAIHELTHSAQKLGNSSMNPYSRNITTFNPEEHVYNYANPNTEIGRRFGEAMVEPIKGQYSWLASPDELHAELLPAKEKLYQHYLQQGATKEHAMQTIVSPTNDIADYLINNIEEKRNFFKPSTSLETKRNLIKLLPAIPPAIIGAGALQKKQQGGIIQDNEGYRNPDNWGKPVKINSNRISMAGINTVLRGISDTGDTQMLYPNKEYTFEGSSVLELPMQSGDNMQQGGNIKPIITNNPNDPRLKAYADSLDAYGWGQEQKANFIKQNREARNAGIKPKPDPFYAREMMSFTYPGSIGKPKPNRINYPVNTYSESLEGNGNNGVGYIGGHSYSEYKKPQQPVVYQKPVAKKPIQKQQSYVAPIQQPIQEPVYGGSMTDPNQPLMVEKKDGSIGMWGNPIPEMPVPIQRTLPVGHIDRRGYRYGDAYQGQPKPYEVQHPGLKSYKNGGWLDKYQDGGEISIFKNELTFDQIPTTDNKKIVIDNFSKDYDYVVEGDKTFYKIKRGNTWKDISDNKIARNNLLGFLDKNNYWSGYNSGEKDMFHNKGIKETLSLPFVQNQDFNSIKPNKGLDLFGKDILKNTSPIIPSVGKTIANELNIKNKDKIKQIESHTQNVFEEITSSMKSGVNKTINNIEDVYETMKNGISRKLTTNILGDDDAVAINPQQIKPKNVKDYYNNINNVGEISAIIDAPKTPGRQFKQQDLQISNLKLGARNRGDYNDINTDGLEITTYNPINTDKLPDTANVLALDKEGTMHIGQYGEFKGKEGYKFSKVFKNNIIDFPEDKYISGSKSGNPQYKQPVIRVLGDDGKIVNGSLNLLIKDENSKNYYGSVQGGRIIFVDPTTKDQHLVSGSIDYIRNKFKELKKDNKYLEAYLLDNGTYSRGLSYKDKKLTPERLKSYDLENTSGGNGFYIMDYKNSVNKFQETYSQTPNVRTEVDKSYKEGHPLKNEVKNVVLHHTGYTDEKASEEVKKRFMTKGDVSSHVVIEKDGRRTVFASPEQIAFHAGESKWNKRDNVNDFSIGVEFQGDTNVKPLTQKQIESFVEYYSPIAKKYNLSLKDIITHQMIAPERKPDITKQEYLRVLKYMKDNNYK